MIHAIDGHGTKMLTFDCDDVSQLTYSFILKNSSDQPDTARKGYFDIHPDLIEIGQAVFFVFDGTSRAHQVELNYDNQKLSISCDCRTISKNLCAHQTQALFNITDRPELRIYFDKKLRDDKMRLVAKDYGLEKEADQDQFFELEYQPKSFLIKPKIKQLLPVTTEKTASLKDQLIPTDNRVSATPTIKQKSKLIIVLSQHKFYNHLYIELIEAQISQEGKVKNPFKTIDPSTLIWKTDNAQEIKFYSGISKFQNTFDIGKSGTDFEGLKAIVKNPVKLDFYYHNSAVSPTITSSSIAPISISYLKTDLRMSVDQRDVFYEITGRLVIEGVHYELNKLLVKWGYFIQLENKWFLIDRPDSVRIIDYFRQQNNILVIHQSKFEEFRKNILGELEDRIKITYSYLKPATKQQIEEQGFDKPTEKLIYLKDSGDYIIINPVIKYGGVEIPILSRKEIYALDAKGNPFTVQRDDERELQFTALFLKQHPDFEEQLDLDYFYLHKNRFLSDDWFLDAFEEWQNHEIKVLGFNEINDNKLNPNKAKISIVVDSGIDWFDTTIKLKYGQQKVSLKHLHKSLRNKSKFVELGDGTLGILPSEWIEKLSRFFEAGEVAEETIRTPKIKFSEIEEIYDEEELSSAAKKQLKIYKEKTSDFESIEPVEVPSELLATLRDYQKQGLNWLNFLDEFSFGGCLADDMGLGKTIQIIAFILVQRKKSKHNTNLIVAPTSLIFNWQSEIEKFAPSIKVLSLYGSERKKDAKTFDQYEVILTSYGTLLSDIKFLKEYQFNYIILDESQNIKNPESQRYKAVRLLQARNRIALTGTPIENNTFDLYGQLSFACPRLLGNKRFFRDHYSTPLDKFKDSKRAKELQKKVNPFMLRRTKEQVATELPEKTEMVLYCEMEPEQRKVYDSYSKEFYNFLTTKEEGDIPRERMHILQGLTKLRQICDSPAILNDKLYYGESSAKINVLMEQIEGKSSQHKILVFSQFVSMLDLIMKELEDRNIAYQYLTGQTTNRKEKIEDFQQREEVRVFLISLKAGGTGLNLTEADYVYLVDPWWNPAVENQAIDRVHRIGQQKKVVAVRLICPNTLEEKIMKLQESKKDLFNDLIKTDTSILKSLTKKDLLELL